MTQAEIAAYTPEQLKAMNEQFAGKAPEEIIRWAAETFGSEIRFASSFGAEDVVVIDMIAKVAPQISTFTLDTGRLNDETYEVMEGVRTRYGIEVLSMFPERAAVEKLEREKGFYSFRESVEDRRECCAVRKVEPLRRALSGLKAWMTGLRRDQAASRGDTGAVEWDEGNGLAKVNPLVDWSNEQVWEYIRTNDVPYNRLHDQGFPSIGCAPCTRAIEPGEDIRAGRWWWELPDSKECGLHH
ncbi:MAG: phosphoadenylyl-sulfate reductase [Candidatus Neomarinimicrobiota bacterium]